MTDIVAPFALPLRRVGDATILDAHDVTVLVVDPQRAIDDDRPVAAIADHVFAMLTAAPALNAETLRDEVLEEAANICEDITSWGLSPTKAEVAKSTQTFCAKAILAQKAGEA